jgi:TPR repeat protein
MLVIVALLFAHLTAAVPAPQTPLYPLSFPSTPEDLERVRQSAGRGEAQDEFTLGFIYLLGVSGVERDPAAALAWFRKASEHGSGQATFFIGVVYDQGQGVPADHVEGVKWFRAAAAQGNDVAEFRLGRAYELGEGVKKDVAEAINWYRRSAAKNNSVAENTLGDLYAAGHDVAQDYAEAAVWYRLSADQGNGYGKMKLAELYDKGLGVPKDPAQAVANYRAEAEHGGPIAQYEIGLAYRDGLGGLARDPIEAHKWFNIAAALAGQDERFAAARGEIEKTMTPLEVAEARRRAHDWVDAHFSSVQPSPQLDQVKQMLLDKMDGRQPR